MRLNSTPKQDGFYMPSELAPHKCTYLLWPERPDNWRMGATDLVLNKEPDLSK